MTTQIATIPETHEHEFLADQVITITGGHFIHDTYSAFVAPLLPLIIEKLSISLTQAGALSAFMQLPSLLNPFIGYLDDKINLRLFVILAPGITATLMSAVGLAPSYLSLAILLFITGMSIAAFHAPAPAMVARVSGRQVGKGMSFFMAGGELGRTVGPLLAVWAVSLWSLEGIWLISVLGWAASLVMYLRFRGVASHPAKSPNLKALLSAARSLFLPLTILVFARSFLITGLGFYLPTFLTGEGASLGLAGGALAIYELAGVGGALASGTLSDRLGRKPVLTVTMLSAPLLTLAFINTSGWVRIVVLLALGLTALSTQPVLMALVQDHFPQHRSSANGAYIAMAFITRSVTAILIGMMGDSLGLRSAFFWIALISLIAVPVILMLPKPGVTSAPS